MEKHGEDISQHYWKNTGGWGAGLLSIGRGTPANQPMNCQWWGSTRIWQYPGVETEEHGSCSGKHQYPPWPMFWVVGSHRGVDLGMNGKDMCLSISWEYCACLGGREGRVWSGPYLCWKQTCSPGHSSQGHFDYSATGYNGGGDMERRLCVCTECWWMASHKMDNIYKHNITYGHY